MGMLCNELLTELLSVKESVETTIAVYRQGCSAKSTERAAALEGGARSDMVIRGSSSLGECCDEGL
jgi:hypothetical protein